MKSFINCTTPEFIQVMVQNAMFLTDSQSSSTNQNNITSPFTAFDVRKGYFVKSHFLIILAGITSKKLL